MTKPAIDEAPKSDFVREMESAIARRLAAAGWPEKVAVDREIRDIIRTHLGRDAWQAMVDAEAESAAIPKAGKQWSRRRARVGKRTRYSEEFDHKLAQAGDRNDE